MNDTLIKFKAKSDFEKNLYLRSEIKHLKQAMKDLVSGTTLKEKDIEIGMLKSEIDELRYQLIEAKKPQYQKLNKNQKKKIKDSITDLLFIQQKEQLKMQDKKIVELKEEIKNLLIK